MTPLIWRDGTFVQDDPPRAGEAAWGGFTTVGCEAGRLFLWERHRERLGATLAALRPDLPVELPPVRALEELLARRSLSGPARLRVVASLARDGGAWTVGAHAAPVASCGPRVEASRLTVVRWPGIPPLADLKTVSRLPWDLARRRAAEEGFDEALLVTRDGQVLEAGVANVFALTGRRLVTPPADGRCLPGVMRAWLLEAAGRLGLEAVEEPLTLDRLLDADEVWLTGSVAGVRRVGGIDERRFGPWPVWEELRGLGVPAPGW